MPRIAARRSWTPQSAKVDWQNPLTAGLTGYGFAFDEWTGIPRRDLPSVLPDADPSISYNVGSPWGASISVANLSNTVAQYVVFDSYPPNSTLMFWPFITDTTCAGVCFGAGDLSVTGLWIGLGLGNYGTSGNDFVSYDLGNRTTGVAVGASAHSLAIASTVGTTGDYFIDGALVSTLARTNISIATQYHIEVGGFNVGTFNEYEGIHGPFAMWKRRLTATEIAKLHADPFQMLRR